MALYWFDRILGLRGLALAYEIGADFPTGLHLRRPRRASFNACINHDIAYIHIEKR